jgi:molybdopterin converting factor small subunit
MEDQKAQIVTVTWHAMLREKTGRDQEEIATRAATPVELYRELSTRYELLIPADSIRFAVNDEIVSSGDALQNGDRVSFLPPVSGG